MSDSLVVRSRIKEVAKDMNVSSDFADALSKKVEELIANAIRRAKENKRSTIQPRDLWIFYFFFLFCINYLNKSLF